jgi:hypothetical protein
LQCQGYYADLTVPYEDGAESEPIIVLQWLPFLRTYRTMCLAPEPGFRQMLEEIRETRLAASAWNA